MAKADLYPKFCTGCGQKLLRGPTRNTSKYDAQTGELIVFEVVELTCPDYPPIGYPSDGVSAVTGVKHDRFQYDIKK